MIEIISKANPCLKNELVIIKCPQQNDGHSCGVHTIMNVCRIAGNIANLANKGSTSLSNEMEMETVKKGDITKTRNWVKDIISIGKTTATRKLFQKHRR